LHRRDAAPGSTRWRTTSGGTQQPPACRLDVTDAAHAGRVPQAERLPGCGSANGKCGREHECESGMITVGLTLPLRTTKRVGLPLQDHRGGCWRALGNVPRRAVALVAYTAPRLPGRLEGDQSQEEQGERRPGHRQLDPIDREVALSSRWHVLPSPRAVGWSRPEVQLTRKGC
jgi:hypothetical protein